MTDKPVTVGEFLRRTRTERGISLERVSQVTRVRLPYLQAIENDEPSEMPSVVQARGFLRLYASFLEIPAQPLLDGWQTGVFTPIEASVMLDEPPEIVDPKPETVVENVDIEEVPPVLEFSDTASSQQDKNIPEGIVEENLTFESEQRGFLSAEDEPPPNSHQIFEQIGALLRDRREALNLSVQDIERFTRLRGFYIEALESGQVEKLPSMVQGRGMLSNYAEFLDLDVEDLLLKFADALQTRRIELTVPVSSKDDQNKKSGGTTKRSRKPPFLRKYVTLDLILGGGVFIFLIAFLLWGASRVTDLQRQAEVPTPPSISEILMTPDANLPSPTIEATPSVTPGQAEANPLVPIDPNAQFTEVVLPTLGSAPISVYIVASQRAWMRVTVDTSVVFDGRVIPGNAYPFTGRERIDLITGNAAALSVIYNENDLGSLGIMGEVVSMTFTREGTLVPTAAFTATPTVTLQPTSTLQPTLPQITPSITPLVP